jgi:hypothetical protein
MHRLRAVHVADIACAGALVTVEIRALPTGFRPCIKAGIHGSDVLSSAIVSADWQLYTLTADNLVDEVARKSISTSGARVELQKAFLEFRDRTNRRDGEMVARENEQASAARLQVQQAEAAATAAQERENERRAAVQAADEARAREDQTRQDEAVEFCISEATQRIGANPQFRNDNSDGQCDLRTSHRHNSSRVPGLADSTLGSPSALHAKILDRPLQRRTPTHGAGSRCSRARLHVTELLRTTGSPGLKALG